MISLAVSYDLSCLLIHVRSKTFRVGLLSFDFSLTARLSELQTSIWGYSVTVDGQQQNLKAAMLEIEVYMSILSVCSCVCPLVSLLGCVLGETVRGHVIMSRYYRDFTPLGLLQLFIALGLLLLHSITVFLNISRSISDVP